MGNAIFRATDTFGVPAVLAGPSSGPLAEGLNGRAGAPAVTMNHVPPELKREIAMHLGGRDRLNFALACKSHHAALAAELLNSRLLRQAQDVRELGTFQSLIGSESPGGSANTIRSLPLGFRADPLLALSRNIVALPLHQQAAASVMWNASVHPIALRCAPLQHELNERARSARLADRVAGINTLDEYRALLGLSGSAAGAMSDTVMMLRADLRIKPLAALASRVEWLPQQDKEEAVRLFLSAARNIDGSFRASIEKLEREAHAALHGESDLHSLALIHSVKSGEAARDVVRRSGVTDPLALRGLSYIEWGVAVKNGERIADAALRYGILGDDQLDDATHLVAIAAIAFGEPLQSVFDTYGITNADRIEELTGLACTEAQDAMRNGGASLPVVVERYGITQPDRVATLTSFALDEARQAILNGELLEAVITRLGLTAEEHVSALTRFRDAEEDRLEAELMGMASSMCRVM